MSIKNNAEQAGRAISRMADLVKFLVFDNFEEFIPPLKMTNAKECQMEFCCQGMRKMLADKNRMRKSSML